MVRVYSPLTLFMTFSCSKYDSEDIEQYLRKVNNVPAGYFSNKLCVEDPMSVSRKYSQQFHALFNEVLVKEQVLGQITHHFWNTRHVEMHLWWVLMIPTQ